MIISSPWLQFSKPNVCHAQANNFYHFYSELNFSESINVLCIKWPSEKRFYVEALVKKTDLSHKWKGLKRFTEIFKTFGLKTWRISSQFITDNICCFLLYLLYGPNLMMRQASAIFNSAHLNCLFKQTPAKYCPLQYSSHAASLWIRQPPWHSNFHTSQAVHYTFSCPGQIPTLKSKPFAWQLYKNIYNYIHPAYLHTTTHNTAASKLLDIKLPIYLLFLYGAYT